MAPAGEEEEEEEGVAGILPGLPDDLGVRCLAFLPRSQHAKLRCVCTCWRDLVTKGLTSFHTLRRTMGLTQDYLVLLCSGYPHKQLSFSEIDLSSPIPSVRSAHFRTKCITASSYSDEDKRWEFHYFGKACIPLGPFVLILGGQSPGPYESEPSGRLHIFDISSGLWRLGASMQSPRHEFAWGVIDPLLYVAGGISGEENDAGEWVETTKRTEVYDFDVDRWSTVANMPLFIYIDLCYVYNQALYVGGYTSRMEGFVPKLFSYNPLLDQWKEEERDPDTFCHPDSSIALVKNITAMQDCGAESLFMLDIQRGSGTQGGAHCRDLEVLKLDPKTSKWKLVYQAQDWMEKYPCCCRPDCGFLEFVIMGTKPVVMVHIEEYEEPDDGEVHTLHTRDGVVELRDLKDVLRLLVNCPWRWGVAVINA